MKWKVANYKSHWNRLVFYDQCKITSDLNMSHGRISDFVSFPLFGFILVIKLNNFYFESHWNTLIFFDRKRFGVRFEYVPWENVSSCFISIVWFCLTQKTEEFWFWWSLKYFNIFDKKTMSDLIMSCQIVSDLL